MSRRALLVLTLAALAAVAYVAVRARGDAGAANGASDSRVTGGCSRSPGREVDGPSAAPSAKTVRDPELRSATRERLRAELGPRFPSPSPSPKPAPSAARPARPSAPAATAPKPDGPGEGPGIEPRYIQERVREDFFPLAKQCYAEALERRPGLAGKVALHFTIVGDEGIGGIVEDATVGEGSTLRDDEFETCMSESMMAMTFPPPKGGGTVTVTYPIDFSPGEEDDDAGAREQGDAGERR